MKFVSASEPQSVQRSASGHRYKRACEELARRKGFEVIENPLYPNSWRRVIFDPQTGATFFEAETWKEVFEVLLGVPSLAGRRPRPDVEGVTREIASGKGYVLERAAKISFHFRLDPHRRIRALADFWTKALQLAIRLPDAGEHEEKADRRIVPRPLQRGGECAHCRGNGGAGCDWCNPVPVLTIRSGLE